MVLRINSASLFCLGIASVTPLVRGTEASTCGFVVPCVTISSQRSNARATARMTLSEGTEAPRPPSSGMPDASSSSPSSDIESAVGSPVYWEGPPETVTRTPTPRTDLNQPRRAEPPPSIESLQTTTQRRRARPLSQLKRVKPKKRMIQEEEGEFRPLIAKTDRESVLRGEDYWIDYRELDAERARKEARARAPPPDQFAQSKMKAEIANPYKQNWILVISIAIAAIATFIKINPDVLSDSATINFPTEL